MATRGVLFDFAGTLFTLDPTEAWLAKLHGPGSPRSLDELTDLMTRLTSVKGKVADLNADQQHAWNNRDLTPQLHRAGYLAVLEAIGLSTDSALALYELMTDPLSWVPYPDTADALRALADRGVPVAVISNIAWDIRPSFKAAGVDDLVADYVLSFEHDVMKPDPRIFQLALDGIAIPAEETLMVGDSEGSDDGAAALGCSFALVEAGPAESRPDALRTVLQRHRVL